MKSKKAFEKLMCRYYNLIVLYYIYLELIFHFSNEDSNHRFWALYR